MKKQIYFKLTVRMMENGKCFYVSDGYGYIENNFFEGHITDDYIVGSFKNNILDVETLRYDIDDGVGVGVNVGVVVDTYNMFEKEIDYFAIPETYTLKEEHTGLEIQLDFEETIIDSSEIEEIKNTIKNVKKSHHISDV